MHIDTDKALKVVGRAGSCRRPDAEGRGHVLSGSRAEMAGPLYPMGASQLKQSTAIFHEPSAWRFQITTNLAEASMDCPPGG